MSIDPALQSQAGRYAILKAARRIWAVGAVHGDAARLRALHMTFMDRVGEGDRIVYLGNYVGVGPQVRETLAELIRFRRWFLAMPPYMDPSDIVHLRGAQEEMWQKLLQLQFANRPLEVLDWMLQHGLNATLQAYESSAEEARAMAGQGVQALTQWTGLLRDRMRSRPGHDALFSGLKRAAVTETGSLLMVSAGLDETKPLDRQNDALWWAGKSFAAIQNPYGGFQRVLRGYDPEHGGYRETPATITLDGGCGFGGPLMALCLTPGGELLDRIAV